ncbi:MAG: Eco57I restriction-modification methylase domain-containing protein, partial [Brevinema sp.]
KYLNGILNSKLIHFWLKNRGKLQGSQLQIDKAPLLQIPLVNEPKEYETMEKLVDHRIKIENTYRNTDNKTPTINNKYHQQVDQIEYSINKIVYALYELSEDEIRIVEA